MDLRYKYKIKLPDTVITATALYHDLILVARNEKDFKKVKELKRVIAHHQENWG
ncbi:PIN domain-containing protein [Thermococcus litoralis]|uniref:PIN domain-containing protein n=1 Tax=Thermococcus litoralis TaxID=2265 RepID=UPI00373AEB15